MPKTLILASTSVFRRRQLEQLGLSFHAVAPECEEMPLAGESAADTAARLARNKAQSLAGRFTQALIIGADQVAWADGRQIGKPMDVRRARQMLLSLSGKEVRFYSAVCLLNPLSGSLYEHTDETVVRMRRLSAVQVDSYLAREPDAVYCAGAAKSEALGVALIERIETHDPNALIGLPLLRLIDFLSAEGVQIV